MSSLIEQATLRLEQLRRAGAVIPEGAPLAQPQSQPQVLPPILRTPVTQPQKAGVTTAPSPPTSPKVTEARPASFSRRVAIDLDALAAAGIVSPNAPRSQIADQFRVIKRPLISNAMGKGASVVVNGNLIMVTSAIAGEGKSFTAINLA